MDFVIDCVFSRLRSYEDLRQKLLYSYACVLGVPLLFAFDDTFCEFGLPMFKSLVAIDKKQKHVLNNPDPKIVFHFIPLFNMFNVRIDIMYTLHK